MAAIVPKFGMLTKEEMVRMKLLQRQKEREAEKAPQQLAKRARFDGKTDEDWEEEVGIVEMDISHLFKS